MEILFVIHQVIGDEIFRLGGEITTVQVVAIQDCTTKSISYNIQSQQMDNSINEQDRTYQEGNSYLFIIDNEYNNILNHYNNFNDHSSTEFKKENFIELYDWRNIQLEYLLKTK